MNRRERMSVMARAVVGVILMGGLLGTGCVTADPSSPIAGRSHGYDELRLVVEEGTPQDVMAGTWEAKGDWLESAQDAGHVQLTVVRKGAGQMESRSTTLRDLDVDSETGRRSLAGPAGTLLLEEDAEGGRTFTLEPDADFFARAEEAGMTEATPRETLQLVCSGVTPEYVAGVNEGSRGLTWAEVIKLHSRGVSLDFVRAVREPAASAGIAEGEDAEPLPPVAYSVDDMVMLSFRGVSPEYIKALRDAGYRFSAGEIADMSFRGVSSSFAARIKEAGYDLSGSELSDLAFRGVNADYMARLYKAGYRFTPRELADLAFRGVSAGFAEALAQPGYEPLGAEELAKLSFRGVDPELIKALRPALPEQEEAPEPDGPAEPTKPVEPPEPVEPDAP